jgi:hypothetical protein
MLSRAGGGIVAANTQASAAMRAAEQVMHDEAVTRRLSADFFDPGAGVDPYAGMPGDWRPNEVDTQGKAMLRRAGEIAVAMKNDPLEAVYGGLKGVVNVVPGTFNLATSALKMSLDGYSYALGDAGEYFRGTDAAQAPLWQPQGDAQLGGSIVGGVASPGVFSGVAKLGSFVLAAREARMARIAQESVVSELGNAGGAGDGALFGGGDEAAAGPNGASLPLGSKRLQFNQPESPWYQPIRNDPTTIGETDYSGHAIDRMQDRGVMPSVVQNTIDTGVATPSRMGSTVYYDSVNNVSVVTNANGKVVTVKYGR